MPITIGTHLGSHEITALHGKGGMGEVYPACDTKLKREVGIKILPEEFSLDADRVGRFQREVDVLASLNHPNIAGIYDLQGANGYRHFVLEKVEGKTRAGRIVRGAILVDGALKIAKSICKTPEAVHEKGIVHRDLKQANVKITRDGNNSPTLLSTVAGKFLVRSVGGAMFSAPRHLLFTHNNSLITQKVNPFHKCGP